ncbi:hypothetical protein KFL_002500110 [Klebsormidium nitens]|uniref:Uncharacterized protein n=1 Tax=Klebsormidium nitens TaxID=105231 RepID=A0A1Y1I5F2_KLENI|nr:hypothetical protein KFL_002500110 [Klebsormidium nitens]|eukprot:GAQ85713.1 hypothetical protein KFL_002500110 [Klebsormidium nitens]
MAAALEILQNMKQMLENRGPDFKLADLFKPFPKMYVNKFCGQSVAQKVEAIREACQKFPSELKVHEDSGLMWDSPLLSVRTNLQAEIEAGQSGIATDQIIELQEGVDRYMLKERCLPTILQWQTFTSFPEGKVSARARFYAMHAVLREFLFEVVVGLGGTKKLAVASAGDSSRPKTSDQDTGESVAIIETNEAHGVYKDEPKEAWVLLTSLKVVLGLRVTARSLTPGNMDLDIKVAGPYGFYDPLPAAKSSLSCDAEAALTLLANYVTPEMVDAPLQNWKAPYEKSKPLKSEDSGASPFKRSKQGP